MPRRIVRALWGDLSGVELQKFFLLAVGMFFLIGSFWPIKILKDSIFINIVGNPQANLPFAKLFSLPFVLLLVIIYSHVVGFITRERLIYCGVAIVSLMGFLFAYFLNDPVIGLTNEAASSTRLIGWLFYMFAEGYSALMVALYWSFINDITTPDSAKKGYGMIIFFSQLGGMISMLACTYLVSDTARYAVIAPRLIMVCSISIIALAGTVALLHSLIDQKDLTGYQGQIGTRDRLTVSFLDGLKVLLSTPYVAGIFGLVCFHEVVGTIVLYHMQVLAKVTYVDPGLINQFLFRFGLVVQVIACLFALFGTSYLQRTIGIRRCLMAYPILLGSSIVVYVFYPSFLVITCVVVISKAMHYALNSPAREVLYIPTSKEIKYRAKAWIDVFGQRGAKGLGSTLNAVIGPLSTVAGGITLSVVLVWTVLASVIGRKFTRVTGREEVIR